MIFPHTEAKTAALHTMRTKDLETLHRFLTEVGIDGSPHPRVLQALLPSDPLQFATQFEVQRPSDGAAIGCSLLHGLSGINQYVHATLFGLGAERLAMLAAGALTVNYAFSMWNLRKVYFWTVAEAPTLLDEGPVPVHHEGTLTEYAFDGDDFYDIDIFALYREDWVSVGLPFLRELRGEDGVGASAESR